MSEAKAPESLTWAFLRAHPEDAARVLESLPPADVIALMQALPARITARALSNLRPSLAAAVLHGVDRNRGSALLAMLDTSMAARVLRQVTEERRIALLAQLRTAKGMALRVILTVPDNSAGAWVDADCLTLTGKVTAGAARQRITAASGTAERIVVLDDDMRPVGWVIPHADTPVAQIAVPIPAVLTAATPLSAALMNPAWSQSPVLPVTTRLGSFIGMLHHERLRQVYEQDVASRGKDVASASGALANGYWQGVTGVLRGALGLLPPVRSVAEIPDER
jgi:magnesium transporter